MRPIDETLIKVPLACASKREAIGALLDLLVDQGVVTDRGKVFDEILAREVVSSTAIGYGAAIPHARSDFVRDTACAFGCTLGEGIDFGPSLSGEATSRAELLFLMVSPRENTTPYIKALAKIARIVKDDVRRDSLRQATGAAEILELLGDLARPA